MNSPSEYQPKLGYLNNPMQSMTLFPELLEEGYKLRLKVTGVSMAPFIKSGSYVTLFKIPVLKLRIGDIIFCQCDDGSFKLHRLIRMKNDLLLTKGDALRAFDPLVDKSGYKGKVVHIENFHFCGMAFQNMNNGSIRLLNFLIAKYQQLKTYPIFTLIGLRSKPVKSLSS